MTLFFCSYNVVVFLTDLTFLYRVGFTAKAVKAFPVTCWLLMQRVCTAEWKTYKKKKKKTNTSPHWRVSSDVYPRAAAGMFDCASVWRHWYLKGEAACRRCHECVGEKTVLCQLFINVHAEITTVPEPCKLFSPWHSPYAVQSQMF